MLKSRRRQIILGLFICALIVGAFFIGLHRIRIDSNILHALPQQDKVTREATEILRVHPALDRVAIDLSLENGESDKDLLVRAAGIVTQRLHESGLFSRIGFGGMVEAMPQVAETVTETLPAQFSKDELEGLQQSRFSSEGVRTLVAGALSQLAGLEGIGQADMLVKDPLGLRYVVLERLRQTAVGQGAQVYRNHLLSRDGKHLLILADPSRAALDTDFSREVTSVLEALRATLDTELGRSVSLRVAGSFRSALDNELIIRRDATLAGVLTSIGIALLLLVGFRRPWVGLLAFVPAAAGGMLALFTYSLLEPEISSLALGFGGLLLAISVDHSIAYLLCLDRPHATRAREASRDVWSVGLFAVLTTVGAFSILWLIGFPLLKQIGLFAALGIGFSFLFVHTVLPLLVPGLKGAERPPLLDLQSLLRKITENRSWVVAGVAVSLCLIAVPLAKPRFTADLQSMNAVSPETLEAEEVIRDVWGDVTKFIYILLQTESLETLQAKSDALASLVEDELRSGRLRSGFVPSMVFPGSKRAGENMEAWREFWTPERRAGIVKALRQEGVQQGFVQEAFDPFLGQLQNPEVGAAGIPEVLFGFLGISKRRGGDGYVLLVTAVPGSTYDAELFREKVHRIGATSFDPVHFADHLSDVLGKAFLRMLLIVAFGVTVVLVFLFFEWRLVFLTLSPLLFSFVCTIATLNLMGRPLDISCLMLSIVVFGLGVDYGIFFVRSQQRFVHEDPSAMAPFRTAVVLAAGSTMVGMLVLAFSRHPVLSSAGTISFLGIGYCLIGAFCVLPPALSRLFRARTVLSEDVAPGSPEHRRLARKHYTLLEPHPRLFARFKMKLDPMFPRLAELVPSQGTVLDVGCGYAVPAVWLLVIHPGLRIVGIDPDPERVRVARRVVGNRGQVHVGRAEDLSPETGPVDSALFLDVAHHLEDGELEGVLQTVRDMLPEHGRLTARATVVTSGGNPWGRRLERLRLWFSGKTPVFRTVEEMASIVSAAGFKMEVIEPTAPGREETWFIGVRECAEGQEQ